MNDEPKMKTRADRIKEAAQVLKEKGEVITQTALGKQLGVSRERARQILAKEPGLAEEIALVKVATIKSDGYVNAVKKLQSENQLLTAHNIAHEMGITAKDVRDYANNFEFHSRADEFISPISNLEFEFFKVRTFSKLLRELDLPITYENLAGLLGKSRDATQEFLRRHPELRTEIGWEAERKKKRRAYRVVRL